MNSQCDFLIIGAGIVGLGVARAIRSKHPRAKITIIEKEAGLGFHASGRNSGVLHAGIYYSTSSLKAKLCLRGNLLMRELCRERKLPINECGKLIVASDDSQLSRLDDLYSRAVANGCTVEKLDEKSARTIEPNIKFVGYALYSPLTASVSPSEICGAIKQNLEERNVEFQFNCRYLGKQKNCITTTGGILHYGHIINTAGLFSDRIAQDFGFGKKYGILPFKGLYLLYTKDKDAVRTNIYPVPDPAFPFLGIHFNKMHDGSIKIGPTAIPALWREQYRLFDNFSLKDLIEIGFREAKLFLKNSFHFRDLALEEVKRYKSSYLINEAAKLVTSIDQRGFTGYSRPGIRAQLMDLETGELVQDFVIEGDSKSTHVLNAVSPGFTCGLSFGEHIVENILP